MFPRNFALQIPCEYGLKYQNIEVLTVLSTYVMTVVYCHYMALCLDCIHCLI